MLELSAVTERQLHTPTQVTQGASPNPMHTPPAPAFWRSLCAEDLNGTLSGACKFSEATTRLHMAHGGSGCSRPLTQAGISGLTVLLRE